MLKGKGSPKKARGNKKPIEQYEHKDKKRINNPPVGLVTPETDIDKPKKTYAYDPHLDPQLQWAGKAEHLTFEVPTVSLHVHERIDPRTIIEAVRKTNGEKGQQGSLFESPEENPPLRDAIEFYKHKHNWSNRLIAGDSLLVMNSLLEKEGMAGKVQMVYIDPPYGIKYGSNFQPFVNKRNVKEGKDEDLTQEPEMIKAFKDTWELEIHSYLTYLRDRLLMARDLLQERASVFVQISDENVHHVRELMDEVFGKVNFVGQFVFKKTGSMSGKYVSGIFDTLLWYSKDKNHAKYNTLYVERSPDAINSGFPFVELADGNCRRLTSKELSGEFAAPIGRRFQPSPVMSSGESKEGSKPLELDGKIYRPTQGRHWSISVEELLRVGKKKRLYPIGNTMTFKKYLDEAPYTPLTNVWMDTMESTFAVERYYVVQTAAKVIQRCVLMTTDPGDLVFDPTCGSGTTAYVAEQWGRRWITCDTSRVALTLAKQRLMTALYDYYELAHFEEGVGSGFKHYTVPHITLKSIANNEPPGTETLYDKPFVDSSRARVSGPFTTEAVPSPVVKPLTESQPPTDRPADATITRSGQTLRQAEWKDELFKTGIRGKKGQRIEFTRLETLPGTRWLNADGETKEAKPQRVVISFGPEHAPLEQRQVALAIEEAQTLVPKPKIVLFAAFQFDPEASKDIDETEWPGVTLLKAQMNADLLTEDLKKKRASNESFWLIGQPEVRLEKIKEGKEKGKYRVEVMGFDYYNTRSGTIESGGTDQIAMWMMDTDYDGRSLFPRQVFFPMAGEKEGWAKLAKNLKAEIDETLIEAYRGTISLPFELGENQRVAVKIIDDRGIESLRILEV